MILFLHILGDIIDMLSALPYFLIFLSGDLPFAFDLHLLNRQEYNVLQCWGNFG